jgi:hypothetical protein
MAAAKLNPDERFEVFRRWVESDVLRQRQLGSLKRAIGVGVDDLERGRYQTYSDANVMRLAEEVGIASRKQLATFRKNRQG